MRTFECLVAEERMQWSVKGSIFARPVYVAVIDVVCDADFLELVRNSLLARERGTHVSNIAGAPCQGPPLSDAAARRRHRPLQVSEQALRPRAAPTPGLRLCCLPTP